MSDEILGKWPTFIMLIDFHLFSVYFGHEKLFDKTFADKISANQCHLHEYQKFVDHTCSKT